jgi:hypothetical protein
MWIKRIFSICVGVLLIAGFTGKGQTQESVVTKSINAEFTDVSNDIVDAIVNRGFVVDYNAKVGEMLNRTAADVGVDKPVYAHAETWQFCSATLSHAMVAVNPVNMAFCPFVVFAYETTSAPGAVVVGYRRYAIIDDTETRDVLDKIDSYLSEIIAEVSQ